MQLSKAFHYVPSGQPARWTVVDSNLAIRGVVADTGRHPFSGCSIGDCEVTFLSCSACVANLIP